MSKLWTLTLKGDDIRGIITTFSMSGFVYPDWCPMETKMCLTTTPPYGIFEGFLKESREISLLQGPQLFMMQSTWPVNWSSKQFRVELQELVKQLKDGTSVEGRGYAGNLPWCNRCKTHHQQGPYPPKCGKCNRIGHQEKDYRARMPATGGDFLQNVTCYDCGEKGHFRNKCPKGRNQPNEGARVRAYVIRIEDPQQNPNMITGERPEKDPKILSFIKADEKKPEDIPIIRDFPEVFPDDLSGLHRFEVSGCYANVQFKRRDDGGIYFVDRIWIPSVGGIRKLIMDEAHTFKYSIHPGADKMNYDLWDLYRWPGMKKDIAEYVNKCLTCSKIKAEHQKPSGLLQQPKIPDWKWEKIMMDLVTRLPRSGIGFDAIWVIVDRLTKSA
ncbi:putative reverse transcriptase domain-containing protein [Tanacetum coccineum]